MCEINLFERKKSLEYKIKDMLKFCIKYEKWNVREYIIVIN